MTTQAHNRFVFCVVVVEFAVNGNLALVGNMTAQLHNRFVFCVVVFEFSVNENQA